MVELMVELMETMMAEKKAASLELKKVVRKEPMMVEQLVDMKASQSVGK